MKFCDCSPWSLARDQTCHPELSWVVRARSATDSAYLKSQRKLSDRNSIQSQLSYNELLIIMMEVMLSWRYFISPARKWLHFGVFLASIVDFVEIFHGFDCIFYKAHWDLYLSWSDTVLGRFIAPLMLSPLIINFHLDFDLFAHFHDW